MLDDNVGDNDSNEVVRFFGTKILAMDLRGFCFDREQLEFKKKEANDYDAWYLKIAGLIRFLSYDSSNFSTSIMECY